MNAAVTPIARVYQHLDALARSLARTNAALARGASHEARTHLDQSRLHRAALHEAQQHARDASANYDPDSLGLLARLKARSHEVQSEDAALRGWLFRQNTGAPRQFADEEDAQTFLDGSLPLAWDFELDLVVLCGASSRRLAHALAARGQRRILAFSPVEGEGFPAVAVVAGELTEVKGALRAFSNPLPKRLAFIPPAGDELPRESYQALLDLVGQALDSTQVERNTISSFGETWAKQGLANLANLARVPSIAALKGAFTGIPMVLLAPGPSLSKNAHLIPALKGKALLVTMSHALSALQKHGIEPDVVLALDAQDLRYHFDHYPIERIPALVLGATVRPELYHLRAQRVFSFSGNASLESWFFGALGEEMHLPSGGSVSHCAFSLGVRMGCDPILLVGQDLAFTGGRVYATGSCDAGTSVAQDEQGKFTLQGYSDQYRKLAVVNGAERSAPARLLTVPGFDGGEVQTSFSFQLFRRWFEESARHLKDTVQLWNCTEGGAYIDGFRHLPLAHALEELPRAQHDFAAALDDAASDLHPEERRHRLMFRAQELLAQLDACAVRAQRCLKLLVGRPQEDALRAAERSLLEALKGAWFLSLLSQKEVNEALANGLRAQNAQGSLLASRALYRLTIDAAQRLRPALVSARDALRPASQRPPAA